MTAIHEMRLLVAKHQLGVMFNPGGVAFIAPHGESCQVSGQDDEADLLKLQGWCTKVFVPFFKRTPLTAEIVSCLVEKIKDA